MQTNLSKFNKAYRNKLLFLISKGKATTLEIARGGDLQGQLDKLLNGDPASKEEVFKTGLIKRLKAIQEECEKVDKAQGKIERLEDSQKTAVEQIATVGKNIKIR